MRLSSILAASAVVIAVTACVKRPVPLGPVTTPSVNQDSLNKWRADSIARADSLRRAEEARQRAEQDSLRALREREQRDAMSQTDALAVLKATIYFDYDQSVLTDAAKTALNAKVPVLQSRSGLRIRITGHTDSRGSAEYNLALGLRRAAETKAYLVANGIEASRIEIFSLGAERPAVQGEGEEVWSKNRRAEFDPLSGGAE